MSVIFKVFAFIIIIINFFQSELVASDKSNIKCLNFQTYFDNDYLPINFLEIKINDYRKWQVNNIRILSNTSHVIRDKFKKKFNADLIFTLEKDIKCHLKARVRTQGDLKDHIIYKDGQVYQSLDIQLLDGHINNITRFKLFLDGTRGISKDEVFMTELLREFNYIAPRTQLLKVKMNNLNMTMLFQEKASKEMLEFHKRREAPILEGDEKYMMRYAADVQNKEGINWPEILRVSEIGSRIQLAKMTNTNWTIKNENFLNTSINALKNLNNVYLIYINNYKDKKNNFSFLRYHLNNQLLSYNSKRNKLRLNIYDILIMSANGYHGLYAHNRKFYWNAFEEFFEPIYYDGEFDLSKRPDHLNFPLENNFLQSVYKTQELLQNLDFQNFRNKLINKNLNLSIGDIASKIEKLTDNIEFIKKLYLEKNIEDLKFDSLLKEKDDQLAQYYQNLRDQKIKIKFLSYNRQEKSFLLCEGITKICKEKFHLNIDQVRNLLEANLKIDDYFYEIFNNEVPRDLNYKFKLLNNEFFKNVKFYYNQHIEFNYDKKNNLFLIKQKNNLGRVFFLGGKVKNVTIKFFGNEILFNKNLVNRLDDNNLTGCLSFIDIKFEDSLLESHNSICEDGINIINSKGKIKQINSQNSMFDGIDIDFSNVFLDKVEIINSYNDCIDFSGGEYIVRLLIAKRCKDKGISVGENTSINLNEIIVDNVDIGIASKDSSKAYLDKSKIMNSKICYSAYKKKQEFNGGYLAIENSSCRNSLNIFENDDYSKVDIYN
jgi:hypothetical protein